jgi:hypothetical protein
LRVSCSTVSRTLKTEKLTELSELPIGNDERAECTKALQCLIAVLLGSILINRGIWESGIAASDLL